MSMQRTLVVFKPDAVRRALVGRLLSRFEDKGMAIVGSKVLQMTPAFAERHYEEHLGKPFLPGLIEFVTSGPVMALVLEGLDAIFVCRKMIGSTYGVEAEPGTIRGDFATYRTPNLVHASDSIESAEREIALWFHPKELLSNKMSEE